MDKEVIDSAWYKPRGYPHFDHPLSYDHAKNLVSHPHLVASHAFYPFLHFKMEDRRYKPGERKVLLKKRDIYYAAHADSHIFAYYARLLGRLYEAELDRRAIDASVLAYRKIGDGHCNIHFAGEAFEIITKMGDCDAVALDVEGFFDNLDHQNIKSLWRKVLGVDQLPTDHDAVFKAITRFAWAERDLVYKQLGIGRRKAEKLHGRLCTAKEYRDLIRGHGLVSRHGKNKGIPQGSPISAVLSNIYMLEVDTALVSRLTSMGATYRRYSDDILLICPPGHADEVATLVCSALKEANLNLSEDKTKCSYFRIDKEGRLYTDDPLQYLGFTFDGQRTLLRSSTLSGYHQRLRTAVKAVKRAVRKARKNDGDVRMRKRKIYERMSHLGRRNFPSYAKRAAKVLNEQAIRRQIRGHWPLLQRMLHAKEENCRLETDRAEPPYDRRDNPT